MASLAAGSTKKKLSKTKATQALKKAITVQQLKEKLKMQKYWKGKLDELNEMERLREQIRKVWEAPDGGKDAAKNLEYYDKVMKYFKSDDLFVEGDQKKLDYKQKQEEIKQAQKLAEYIIERATERTGFLKNIRTAIKGKKRKVAVEALQRQLKMSGVVLTVPSDVIDIVKDTLSMLDKVAKFDKSGNLLSGFQPFDEELSVELKF